MQMLNGDQQKKKNNGYKINQVAAIEHTPADAAVMKINTQHFNIIIGTVGKKRNFTDGIKSKINKEANKAADQKGNYRIIGKAAATNADSCKYGCQ